MVGRGIGRDYRCICLLLALAALAAVFSYPVQRQPQPVYRFIFIVDITRSMNAADYAQDGVPLSRLQYVKQVLRGELLKLPCGSEAGLGVFTERRSALLFEPVEVCSGFADIDAAIAALDWRMAWAADSRIANGLFNTLEMLQNRDSKLVFITDGQEAPPINPRYRPDFSALRGKVRGMIVGAGGLTPVPIPKFDASGEPQGVYSANEVPHRTSYGESELDPAKIEGYNARNAPFGSAAAAGSEHLTALREAYLQQLSAEAGLAYHRLEDAAAFDRVLHTPVYADIRAVAVDVRWKAAIAALALLLAAFAGNFRFAAARLLSSIFKSGA